MIWHEQQIVKADLAPLEDVLKVLEDLQNFEMVVLSLHKCRSMRDAFFTAARMVRSVWTNLDIQKNTNVPPRGARKCYEHRKVSFTRTT